MDQKINKKELLFDNKMLIALIVPLVIEQLLSTLVGMADSIMIASVGEAAVSGVSLVDSIIILLFNVFSALATGGAVIAGQYLGQKNQKEGCEASTQLLYFTTFIAIIIAILCFLCKGFILNTVFGQIDEVVKGHANTYLMITLLSIPFLALYCGGAAIFRCMGNSKVSMKVSMVMNAINVSGNAICIFLLKMGTAGVAIPTLISRVVASLMITSLLFNQENALYIPKKLSFKPNWKIIKKILYIGVPNGMENSMFQLGKIIVLSLVSTFGTSAIAANAVSNSVAGFQVLPGMAMGLAMTTVIARCVGANDFKQAEYYTKKLLKIAYASVAVTVVFIYAATPLILKLYNLTDVTATTAKQILTMHGFCAMVIWPTAFTLPNVFRSAGDVRFSMTVSILSMWICRICFSYVFGKFLGIGVLGIWMAMILDWIVRAIFFVIRYKSKKWQQISLV